MIVSIHCLEEGCIGMYIPNDQEISWGPRDVPSVNPKKIWWEIKNKGSLSIPSLQTDKQQFVESKKDRKHGAVTKLDWKDPGVAVGQDWWLLVCYWWLRAGGIDGHGRPSDWHTADVLIHWSHCCSMQPLLIGKLLADAPEEPFRKLQGGVSSDNGQPVSAHVVCGQHQKSSKKMTDRKGSVCCCLFFLPLAQQCKI